MRAPSKLHIISGDDRLCGDTTWLSWPDWCMDDKYARTLPTCGKCLELSVTIRGDGSIRYVVEEKSNELTNDYTTLFDYLSHGREQ